MLALTSTFWNPTHSMKILLNCQPSPWSLPFPTDLESISSFSVSFTISYYILIFLCYGPHWTAATWGQACHLCLYQVSRCVSLLAAARSVLWTRVKSPRSSLPFLCSPAWSFRAGQNHGYFPGCYLASGVSWNWVGICPRLLNWHEL